jgi:hypothetical protein
MCERKCTFHGFDVITVKINALQLLGVLENTLIPALLASLKKLRFDEEPSIIGAPEVLIAGLP